MIRAVLDESVPRQLAQKLRDEGLDARAFVDVWKGLPDGAVLDLVEADRYDVFITCDRGLLHQQRLSSRPLAVIELPTNRKRVLIGRAVDIAETARTSGPGDHIAISARGQRVLTSASGGTTMQTILPPIAPFRL